jgi:hypothetical protein
METYGAFEIGRTVDSGVGSTVYEARKEGDKKGRYAVKVFALERMVFQDEGDVKTDLDPLFKDLGSSFTDRVNLQKKAAQGSAAFAPIIAAGHDERGAWYAMPFYTRSVKGMLERFVVLEGRDLFHIAISLVKAALYLKRTAGRSHGNLKPSNIFVDGTGRISSSRVVVSDPLPGGTAEAAVFEVADLRAIGQVIYQLVLRRKVDFESGWVILPVESTKEWRETFGAQTRQWLDLCNRLLDPGLSGHQYSLEKLEADLRRLKPKPPPTVWLVPAGALAIIVLAAVAYYYFRPARTSLVIKTDPPGATVTVTLSGEAEGRTTNSPASGRALNWPWPLIEGTYDVKVSYTNLAPASFKVGITKGQTTKTNRSLAYGGLIVLSDPPGADFELGAGPQVRRYQTPFTNRYFTPGPVAVQLNLAGYDSTNLSDTVPLHGALLLTRALQKPPPGDVLVAFVSDPPGAEILVDGNSLHKNTPFQSSFPLYSIHSVTASPPWPGFRDQSTSFTVEKGLTNFFTFPHGTLDIASDPAGARVELRRAGAPVFVGATPTNIFWPPGSYELVLSASGYYPTNLGVAISPGDTQELSPVLVPRAGVVEVSSDPAGAEIRDDTGKVLATTVLGGQVSVGVPPKKTLNLTATYPGLNPVGPTNVQVDPGKMLRLGTFRFDYGAVMFADVQPANATISMEAPSLHWVWRTNQVVCLQPPGQTNSWQISAPGYETAVTNIAVGLRETKRITLVLERQKVPVQLASDPPGARFFTGEGVEMTPGPQGYYQLPWGPAEIVARYARLGSLSASAQLQFGASNTIPVFKFDYGQVILTNLDEAISLREGSEELVSQPGPPRFAYDKPGSHTYDLYWAGEKIDTVTTNVVSGMSVVLHSRAASHELANAIGMWMVKVPNLGGPGKPGWVGKYEVTQREYEAVMGENPSGHKLGTNYPVENVSWSKAQDFCQRLTQLAGSNPLLKGVYQLPTREQWLLFAKDATTKDSVVRTGQPAAVGSKGANPLGLCDTRGNVWEWLADANGANRSYIGGAYDSWLPKSIEFGATEDRAADDAQPDIGFRVILLLPQ